jgi:DeoR family deoxyribose operon repressor
VQKTERQLSIINALMSKSVMTVKELAGNLLVSEMTIRRDLYSLEQSDDVEMFYGGVHLKNPVHSTLRYAIEEELGERTEQKRRIAKKAASLIEPNDVLLIDTGSTTSLIVDYLPNDRNHIVYCYALNIINSVCEKNLRVVACGGFFHSNTRMFESMQGAAQIQSAHVNKAFMAARGITEEAGITTAEPYEIQVKKASLSVSEQRILLVDSSKFGKVWYAKYADVTDINIIITDDELQDRYKDMIESKGITLYMV